MIDLLLLRSEFAIRKRVAFDQRQDRVAEEIWVRPVVPAERGFVQVRGQVLDAELVVRADHAAVEEAPNALHGVRVNLTVDPFVARVVDPLMPRVLVTDAAIRTVRVGVDRLGIVGYDVIQEAVNARVRCVGSHAKPDLTTALDSAENHRLVVTPLPRRVALGVASVVPVAGLISGGRGEIEVCAQCHDSGDECDACGVSDGAA
jgi:hypothetical protein